MKKREIQVWMAAAGLVLGIMLSACGADSVSVEKQSSTAAEVESTVASQTNIEETEGSTEETGSEEETDSLEETQGDDADNAVLLEEGAVEDGVYEGIVVDASMNNFAIRTEEGVTYFMERPENGESLKDGLLLGISVKVTIKDGKAEELTDGEKQPASGQETLNFAISVMDAFRYEDMKALTTLMKYPASVVLEGDMVYEAEDAEAMEEIGAERIFTKELGDAIRSTNLYELKASGDGSCVMGQSEGGCRVIFEPDEDNDRGFSIRSIEGPVEAKTAG